LRNTPGDDRRQKTELVDRTLRPRPGGCEQKRAESASGATEQYQDKGTRAYTSFASVLGATALVAGVIALITASTVALAILVVATLALWLVATVRHALIPRAVPGGDRDTHEVIHPEKTGP
jgi:Flp pilus assembly protein TadB